MRGRRRVRFVTGGESLFFNLPRRVGGVGYSGSAGISSGGAPRPVGFRCRLASKAETRQWPVMKEEQSFWVVTCERCDAWAYGRKRRDVMAWGSRHLASHSRRIRPGR